MNRLAVLAAVATLAVATPVLAHPKVVSATPATGAAVASPRSIELRMSETLMPRLSGASMVMTGMPGMPGHAPMKMTATTTIGADGKTIRLTPAKKLPAGNYRIDWHAVAGDTHRVTGTHEFAVK
ncbi:MAG: copC [Sphingomonas bacterium]|nr:copC [Sphingomonas bacterium]